MEKEKKVPFKKYIILSLILILTIIVVIYIYLWYSNYQDSKLNTPIMDKYMQVVNYNELNNYLVENKDFIMYSSILENEQIRSFEIKFRKLINNNSLRGKILYLDLTNELKNKNIQKSLKETYQIEGKDITNVPSLIIFKDGKVDSILNIKEENYDIKKIEEYLIEKSVISD